MFRAFRSTRRKSVRATAASFALAVALAGGVAMGSAAVSSDAAYAQNNSRGFAEAYQPLADMVNATPPNYEGARAAIPTMLAAVENPNDRQVAGNLVLNIGNNLSDPVLQRQGLELMLESGLVAPEQAGQFNWFVGSLAFNAEDYAAARAAFEAAMAAGYSPADADMVLLIAESYDREDNPQASLNYIMQQVEAAEAAGNPVPEGWLLNALQNSYDYDLSAEALTVSEALVREHPSQRNWQNALRIVNQLYELDPSARVDLFRLMRLQDAMADRQEFVRYIEDLDPRVMSNEVQMVLAAGLDAGVFDASDGYYTEVKAIADQRAPQDRSSIDSIVADAESGDGLDAVTAGDVLYSLQDFARAETMYRLALERGYNANTANTRIGITQAQQGNYAAAAETFATVSGPREPVARMWIAYTDYMQASGEI